MALSHIVMHVALCNAALRLKTQSRLAVRVVLTDRLNRDVLDRTFTAYRDNGNDVPLEFDVPWGTYRASVKTTAGRTPCSAVQYVTVLSDHNRVVNVSLSEGSGKAVVPALVMGTAPFAFSYVQPTVVAFDKSVACNGPVGDPLDAGIETQNDSDGYYAAISPNATLAQHGPVVVAVRLTDSRGGYHYIRVPAKILGYSGGWPSSANLNVNEDVIDYVADKPEDTLLCPKMYETTAQ
jgi:hypothetical protein